MIEILIGNIINKGSKYTIIKRVRKLPLIVSVISIILFLYDIGFDHLSNSFANFRLFYFMVIISGIISIIGRFFFKYSRPRLKALPFDLALLLYLMLILNQHLNVEYIQMLWIFEKPAFLYFAIFLVFIRELSALKMNIKRTTISPAQLFVSSFISLIVLGALLLMLPNATVTKISFVDAIFTSTSAVCVTGLVVVDTGSFFTQFGQILILLLFQLGGIGIMTFASYFSFFFRGVSSYENQFALTEITNTERIGEVFSILKKIIIITFIIEGIGAFFILHSIDENDIVSLYDRIFFSVFHSISGFCNAGFSTLPNSFFETTFRFNYFLHLIIAMLIIIGGIGFPIVLNIMKFIQAKIVNVFQLIFAMRQPKKIPWIININTRIVVATTLILIFVGTFFFFIFEYNNSLSDHRLFGKLVASFFGAVTSRTAGFNTVDTASLSVSSTMIIMLLMWIGASPGSTGGGIKTSTFAIAILNIISIARGKSRLEVFRREISGVTINRAFAIIVLSVVVLFVSIFLISLFDSHLGLLNISFECISAFSTVGLSRGITSDLSAASRIILIFTMFIGRVSLLTILIALFRKIPSEEYRYPSENILIN